MLITCATVPPVSTMADNPSAATNTTMAPDPNMGGDLAAAIALLAQTLAAQNTHPWPTQNTPIAPVTSLTRLRSLIPSMAQMPTNSKFSSFSAVFIFRTMLTPSPVAELKSHALSFLMGPAPSWFEPTLFNPALHGSTIATDWDLFHTELETNFGLFDPVGEAKAEIKMLVMA